MPRRSVWIIFGVVVFSLVCYHRADRNPYGRWFAEVLDMVDRYYVEPVDEQKLFEGALSGMVGKLDEYSSFVSRTKTPDFQQSIDQQYGGVGIEVSLEGENKQLTVMSPLVGTPAYKAGVRAGDKIVAIDGKSTANKPLDEIIHVLRGKPGERVSISVLRKGHEQPLQFDLVRARIKVDSILGDTRAPDGSWNFFLPGDDKGDDKIGYVRINAFTDTTADELDEALAWLVARNCRGVVLDMRNNPGGLLQAAEQVCDLFLPQDAVIVTTRGRDGKVMSKLVASGSGEYQSLPLTILVNDKSASASEIVAACLQDNGRAAVIGERTWGKGTVQNLIPLEGGRSVLKLTIASYWRPNGRNIHRLESSTETDEWGVKPDDGCALKLDEKQTARWLEQRRRRDVVRTDPSADDAPAASPTEFDPQLEKAVEILKKKLPKAATGSA